MTAGGSESTRGSTPGARCSPAEPRDSGIRRCLAGWRLAASAPPRRLCGFDALLRGRRFQRAVRADPGLTQCSRPAVCPRQELLRGLHPSVRRLLGSGRASRQPGWVHLERGRASRESGWVHLERERASRQFGRMHLECGRASRGPGLMHFDGLHGSPHVDRAHPRRLLARRKAERIRDRGRTASPSPRGLVASLG